MQSTISNIVNRFAGGASSVQIANGAGAEFEMWLLLELANRLGASPFNAVLRDARNVDLMAGGTFVLRGAPGFLGRGAACHVAFDWKGEGQELHANVSTFGRSGETHEIDICMIPASIADQLRALGGGRVTGQSRLTLECKYKNSVGSKDEARQVVARQFDMTFLFGHPVPWWGRKHSIWAEAAPANGRVLS